MTMVAQNFKILSERTVHGSALVTLSDTKQGFIVPREKRKAKVYGEWAMLHLYFLYVFNVFVFTTNLIPSTRHGFFDSISFEKLSLRNR